MFSPMDRMNLGRVSLDRTVGNGSRNGHRLKRALVAVWSPMNKSPSSVRILFGSPSHSIDRISDMTYKAVFAFT